MPPQQRVITKRIPFAELGAWQPVPLRGVSDTRRLTVGIRGDRIVSAAQLKLTYTYSPALVFHLSHLKISVNDEVVATIPLDKEHAGRPTTTDIPLDPRFFTDFTQIGLHLVAHYTLDHCEEQTHSSLWVDVSPASEVLLDLLPIELANDLGLLPAPFFDHRESGKLILPFVLPREPDTATLRSAGMVSSWFGALADYRHARFPVVSELPGDEHAVVVGTADRLPAGLQLPMVDGPTLMVIDHPITATNGLPGKKLLIVTGRTSAEVDHAAYALVLSTHAMSGASAKVARIDIGAPRKPYDAPRWLPVDRPIAFRELVDNPLQLQASGSAPEPIRLTLNVPADLYSWNGNGVPLNLKYRYTAPTIQNNSSFTVAINDQLVKSYRLSPKGAEQASGQLKLPLTSDPNWTQSAFDIPAFRVGSTNQLQLRFTLDSQVSGLCTQAAANPALAALDPDSTIDFSKFVHFARLPDLAFFANSGFPFTRHADLAQTAIMIREHPSAGELETLLTMLGHMGRWTGIPALRVQIARPAEIAHLAGKDVLIIDGAWSSPLLRDARAVPSLAVLNTAADRTSYFATAAWRNTSTTPDGEVRLNQQGPLAALLGFELPGSKGRSVVALTATEPERLDFLLDAFEQPDRVAQMRGDLAIVRRESVESLRVGTTYIVGYVPWYAWLWNFAIRHPIVVGLLGILGGMLLTIGAYAGLRGLAARRQGI